MNASAICPQAALAVRSGLLVMRSYVLAGNSAHYDGVIAALEARGLKVIPAFASGLDARPAIERYFLRDGVATVDAVVSLTGFSLVGGPAYNDARAAEELLARLDVPYVAAHPVEFQTLEQWQADPRGLMPVEATMMVAIPELDGAIGPMTFGGRSSAAPGLGRRRHGGARRARRAPSPHRVARLVDLRRVERSERRARSRAVQFPAERRQHRHGGLPLGVRFAAQHAARARVGRLYGRGARQTVDELRERIVAGNAANHGMPRQRRRAHPGRRPRAARALARGHRGGSGARHPAATRATAAACSCWARSSATCSSACSRPSATKAIRCGCCSSRALRRRTHSPRSIAGCARISRANAVLHFGTHGALEFMPGKQAGMSGDCWPDRLIGDLPNFYLYAANNPSEGTDRQAPRGARRW